MVLFFKTLEIWAEEHLGSTFVCFFKYAWNLESERWANAYDYSVRVSLLTLANRPFIAHPLLFDLHYYEHADPSVGNIIV
jgi:hypothetical protein